MPSSSYNTMILGGKKIVKSIDWQLIIFVGVSTLHDYWIYWGLPRIYYYEMKKEGLSSINSDDDDNINKRIA
jgi:hypothetical protein